MGSYSGVSTIVQNWREHPPSSYSLKIHNFSQFENSTTFSNDKYHSHLFSSGGYKWRLIVYPKGNKKDNGSGFISMYVEIDSKSLMLSTPPNEVFAELRFFVYNKKENKYFTIHDLEVKKFNALKMVWGLVLVLPYDTFNDSENGYIFEGDQCEFGVDVIVAPPLTNWEILYFNEKLTHPKFIWTVQKFSELKEDVYSSNTFSIGGTNWILELYPKGTSRADSEWLSVFLYIADNDNPKNQDKIFTKAHLRILDPFGSNHFSCQMNDWHKKSDYMGWCCGCGWERFLSLDEVLKLYLDKEDSLNFEVEFKVVSATKFSPII